MWTMGKRHVFLVRVLLPMDERKGCDFLVPLSYRYINNIKTIRVLTSL